uniref:Uncharacterized protein LOC117311089 isoform X2 n=1 Tax=Tursiops truncatus TaxID=9739 RepID=A0A6J3QYM7_TURTR|nr:uncharacterized protein LOC117311089 isoform X2 [Tursiops truncatus]
MQSFYGKCTGANFTWSLKLVTAVLTLPKPFKWPTAPRPPPAVNVTHLYLTSQCFFLLQSSHCVEICLHVYFCYLIVRSFRARLEFMLSADRVPKLFCERMNHVLASRSSKEGKILEHWGCLRSLRDELEASVQGADSEHPGWEGCQELGPLRSLLPGSPAYPGFQRDPTSPSATAPSSDRGGQSTAPTGPRIGCLPSAPSSLPTPLAHRTSPGRGVQDAPPRPPHSAPLPARAHVAPAAARRGGAWALAFSQPRSQRALRRSTRADPVTHIRRANSLLALYLHTLTPGSRWRRQRRGTPTPGTRTRSPWKTRCGRWGAAAPPAGTAGKARTRTRTSRVDVGVKTSVMKIGNK